MPPRRADSPNEQHDGSGRFVRGMWIRNTARLLHDSRQVDAFIHAAKAIHLTDAYLHVSPEWFATMGAAIAAFNTQADASGIRVWALDGGPAYIRNLASDEALMAGLRKFIEYNDRVAPSARFYGFQADIEPRRAPAGQGNFHSGIAESDLTALQQTERDIRMHIWINCLTRASNFLHSYGLPFGAVIPFWLHVYEGEPVTGSWTTGRRPTGKPGRTCMMDMIMPLLDVYVVKSSRTEPAETIRQIMTQVRYACELTTEGRASPIVLGSVETAHGVGADLSYRDTDGKDDKTIVLEDLDRVESVMAKYPAFGGMVIHDWSGWEALPP